MRIPHEGVRRTPSSGIHLPVAALLPDEQHDQRSGAPHDGDEQATVTFCQQEHEAKYEEDECDCNRCQSGLTWCCRWCHERRVAPAISCAARVPVVDRLSRALQVSRGVLAIMSR
jgi:hypothetical protein